MSILVRAATTSRPSRRSPAALAGVALLTISAAIALALPTGSAASPITSSGESSSAPLTGTEILDVVADAGYVQGAVPTTTVDANSALVSAATDIPRDGGDPMRAGTTVFSVPSADGETGRRLDNNSVGFVDGNTATVVQPTAMGDTQVVHIARSAQDAREFAITVSGDGELVLDADGGVDVMQDGASVNHIKPPKATLTAADGSTTSPPTRFVIKGRQVVQVTDIGDDVTGTVALDHWWNPIDGCIAIAGANVRYTAVRGVFVTAAGYAAATACAARIGWNIGKLYQGTAGYQARWNARLNGCWPHCSSWDFFRLVTGI